jgi:hypothetical protein
MELRPIPFIEDARYRIAQDGTVWGQRRATARSRVPRFAPRPPMTLEEASSTARAQLANAYFPLVEPEHGIVHHVAHRGPRPTGEARLVGSEFRAVGDTRTGWYSLLAADGTMHLFHGPSIASVAFPPNR